jgi:hypothetical protein
MTAGNWKPLFWSLGALFIIAIIFSFVISSFPNNPPETPTGASKVMIDYINGGTNITIPLPLVPDIKFNFNIFAIFGSSIRAFISNMITTISVIPEYILIPSLILFSLAIIYSIVKLFLP